MKQRKILSGLLVLALMLGLCVPVSATDLDETSSSTTVTFTSTLKLPTIKVTIGTGTDMTVNPYNMKVNIGGTDKTESLITTPVEIKSTSTIGITITADPKVTVDAGTDVETATLVGKTLTKPTVFMQFSMGTLTSTLTLTPSCNFDPSTASVKKITIGKESLSDLPTLELDAGSDSDPKFAAFQITGETGGPGWSKDSSKVGATVAFNIAPKLGTGTAT